MKRFFALILIAALAWTGGLFVFVDTLPNGSAGPVEADGVVVYTGGVDRVSSGMSLLENGVGRRLLISGVNRGTGRDQLRSMWNGAPELFDCCVDLGHQAESTAGNAGELREWAAEHGFQRIIIVTSDFHMPRALVESRRQSPGLVVTPYPVASGVLDADGRPVDLDAWKKLAAEYTKFLAARVLAFFG